MSIQQSHTFEPTIDAIYLTKTIQRAIALERAAAKGRIVTVLVGRYAGRKARIDQVIFSGENGFMYLCMVLRMTNDGVTPFVLNSDAESRSFRLRAEFRIEEGDGNG